MEWAHLGSNQGPTGYEPVALPAELWARWAQYIYFCAISGNVPAAGKYSIFKTIEDFRMKV